MGVDARLVVYAPDLKTAEDACTAAFERIAELDSILSDYRRDSELNRLSDRSGGAPVRVSSDLFRVMERAIEVSRRSDGAFDVTVGPSVRLWREARKTRVLPTLRQIEEARRRVGWKFVRLDHKKQTVQLLKKGMQLDMGGIAKGYAGDEAQKALRKFGVTSALIEMGGDIVVSGPPPGTDGWKVRTPNAGEDLTVVNQAISSSGDTEQFAIIGGKQYSHVIDPRTGWALTNRVQVTIIAPDGLTTDPLSTALTILSPAGRAKLLKHYPGAKTFARSLKFLKP